VDFQFSKLTDWLRRHAETLCRLAAYTSSVLVAAPTLYHLAKGSPAHLGFFEDDYFYYAIIADNLAIDGRPTFDGTTLTNGVHPLWFVVIALLRIVFGRFGTAFYVALTALSVIAMIVTYELGRRLARELGASSELAAAIPVVYSVATARLLTTGMECVIAVPLFLWLLVESARPIPVTHTRAARLGFIASLAILARLDLAIAVALLLVGFVALVRPGLAALTRLALAFGAGGVLVPLYLVANYVFFGAPMPVSAMAKRLYTGFGFNFKYASIAALGTMYGPSMAVVLPMGLIALVLLVAKDSRWRPAARLAGAVALVFTFVFLGLNALSGWTFFGWYAYPFAVTTTVALVFISQWLLSLVRLQTVGVAIAAVLVALQPLFALRHYVRHGPQWTIHDNTLLAMTYELGDRMLDRDGLIAMGAIAGYVTYMIDRPVLQLEAVVSDPGMLEHLRREDPLEEVLRKYNADYLVVSLASERSQPDDGCYVVTQPHAEWAGERSAKMRGRICSEPIEHFFTERGPHPWSRFPALETLVWDLRSARWDTSTESN
jgi:hypothetical protein